MLTLKSVQFCPNICCMYNNVYFINCSIVFRGEKIHYWSSLWNFELNVWSVPAPHHSALRTPQPPSHSLCSLNDSQNNICSSSWWKIDFILIRIKSVLLVYGSVWCILNQCDNIFKNDCQQCQCSHAAYNKMIVSVCVCVDLDAEKRKKKISFHYFFGSHRWDEALSFLFFFLVTIFSFTFGWCHSLTEMKLHSISLNIMNRFLNIIQGSILHSFYPSDFSITFSFLFFEGGKLS